MRAARGALKPRPPRCCHPLYRLPLRCPRPSAFSNLKLQTA